MEVIKASDELVAFQVNGSAGTQDAIDKARERQIPVKKNNDKGYKSQGKEYRTVTVNNRKKRISRKIKFIAPFRKKIRQEKHRNCGYQKNSRCQNRRELLLCHIAYQKIKRNSRKSKRKSKGRRRFWVYCRSQRPNPHQ